MHYLFFSNLTLNLHNQKGAIGDREDRTLITLTLRMNIFFQKNNKIIVVVIAES